MLKAEEPNYSALPVDDSRQQDAQHAAPTTLRPGCFGSHRDHKQQLPSTLEARLKTFSHHAAKLLDPRVSAGDAEPQAAPDPEAARTMAAVAELARVHLCQPRTRRS